MGEECEGVVFFPKDGLRVFFCRKTDFTDMTGKKRYMLRTLELAVEARGRTSPNPMVGAVVVRGDRVVGEGYHRMAGGLHAEAQALGEAGGEARGADLYVNLEPCSHFGRTPPCTESIIEAGVARVFAAIEDPNPLVAGKGAKRLRRAGISVRFGLAVDEATRLNEAFLKFIRTGLPFVFIKSAMTLDGKTATRTGDSRWVSGEESRALVHGMRDGVDAVMVGIGTVIADDPRLTTRLPRGEGRNPHRIVIDPLLRIPLEARVLSPAGESRTIVVTTGRAPKDRIGKLESLGAEVMVMEGEGRIIDLSRLMRKIGERKVTSVMIEGGAEVTASALSSGIVDKVVCFIAPKIVGGREAPTTVGGKGAGLMSDALELREVRYRPVGEDIMAEGYLRRQGD
jgi:diaminohydroxyphosphoribosylaminopyrimidine deaminase/5-amino-6-(5-phosphoribosylamino)uracil reductase